MSDRAKLPLNNSAVAKADDQFYAQHPEFVQDGKRVPLSATDPKQAALRKQWMANYVAGGGELEGGAPGTKKPSDPTHSCPVCPEGKGQLVVTVIDNYGVPVENATVTAGGMTKQTDAQGVADFGTVDAKTYDIAASKKDYTPFGPYANSVEVPSQEKVNATLGLTTCVLFQLAKPFMIARAVDDKLKPLGTVALGKAHIPDSTLGPIDLDFGQDITHESGRAAPATDEKLQGSDEQVLKDKMNKLLDEFAFDDPDGKAKREFAQFQAKNSTVTVFSDPTLDKATSQHENFLAFSERVLAAPGTAGTDPSKTRIHQALAAANWDINKVTLIDDLKPFAYNLGEARLVRKNTGDWANGLKVMINGVDYVLVFVTKYEYDNCKDQYTITLVFEIYDIFGLDDVDLHRFGAKTTNEIWTMSGKIDANSVANMGITSWWQLQHQFNYAPPCTKAVVTKTWTVSTK